MAGSQDQEDDHSFAFLVNEGQKTSSYEQSNLFMVDCGATAHIVTDESQFVRYDHSFCKNNHFIELADGTRTNCVALKRGEAIVKLTDSTGRRVNATLKNALFIPSYPHNIFSAKAATENGATVKFGPTTSEMIDRNGTKFNIVQKDRLYFFENVDLAHDETSQVNKVRSIQMWHKILGHCI